jgi:hypothetical protein
VKVTVLKQGGRFRCKISRLDFVEANAAAASSPNGFPDTAGTISEGFLD